MSPINHKLEKIADFFKRSDNFLITCHNRPDGDALGSMLALKYALNSMGKNVTSYCEDTIVNKYRFLPGIEEIVNGNHDPEIFMDKNLVILDCNDKKRVYDTILQNINKFNSITIIDHHEYFTDFFDDTGFDRTKEKYEYIDPKSAATGRIVYDLIKSLDVKISSEIATNLYLALSFDTGGFKHSNTTSEVLRIAAEMIECGADPHEIANHLYFSNTINRLYLLRMVLDTIEFYFDNRVGFMTLTYDMLQKIGVDDEDTGDFIIFLRSIESVEISIFIKEHKPNEVRVSLRSRNTFDVASFAREFGGGGHKKAAGFASSNHPSEVKEKILEKLKEYFV